MASLHINFQNIYTHLHKFETISNKIPPFVQSNKVGWGFLKHYFGIHQPELFLTQNERKRYSKII